MPGLKVACGSPVVSHLLFANDSFLFSKASLSSAREIKRILIVYEKALGQQINFQKSVLIFSLNVGVANIDKIENKFGIDVVSKHSKYMGLPSSILHNCTDIFKPIVDRIANKVRGWKEKLFSIGSKEILIKAMVQAIRPISTYTMSLFWLLVGTIDSIHASLQNF